VQDAVAKVGDLVYDPRQRAFTAVLNRYRWEETARPERVRAALRIDDVTGVRARGIALGRAEGVVNLLALEFRAEGEPPGGVMRLVFSGGGEIEATVECIDVSLLDLTRPWRARAKPQH
jgi:hypothetical protein